MALITSAGRTNEINRELVQRWEVQLPALKQLLDETLDKDRGFEIPKERCLEICGDAKMLGKVLPRWKDAIVWLRGITIKYEPARKSYRFINVHEHLTERNDRIMRSSERRHREEALRLNLIRDVDMGDSDTQRKLRVLIVQQHIDTAGKLNAQREMARLALSQPETLPSIVRAKDNGS